MAFNFPSNPINGQVFTDPSGASYTFNGYGWVESEETEFVLRAGDTMTGFLTLNAAPTDLLHAATKKYVDDSIVLGDPRFVNVTGDTMTGNLTIQKSAPRLSFDATDANGPYIEVKRNNVLRWFFYLAGDPETGSNVGSDFYIQSMNDAGGSVAFPLRIERKTGVVKLQEAIPSTSTTTGALTVAGGVGIQGAANISGTITAGLGGTGAGSGWLTLNGGSTGSGGGIISLQKNSVYTWHVGHASIVLGTPGVDDFVFYGVASGFQLRLSAATGQLSLSSNTPSTSPTTGALTVAGGVGVAGALYTGGIIVIAKATPIFYMNDLGGAGNYISAQRNGLSRWEMSLGAGSESGSNAGSDFVLNRYSDAGGLLGSAIVIRRNNGDMTVGGGFVVQAADPTMFLQKAADANVAQMYIMSSGAARWLWHYADQTNNNMQLYRCNAAGGIVDGPFGVNWATGKVAMSSNIPATSSTTGTLTVAGGLGVAGNIYSGAMIHSPAGITVSPSLPDTNHSMTFDAALNGPYISGFQGLGLGIQGVKALVLNAAGDVAINGGLPGYKLSMTFPGGGVQYGFGIKQSADTTIVVHFLNSAGTPIGGISSSTSTIAYNTSSDMRLKKDLKKFDSDKIVDAINVYDFAWETTGERSIGIVAQEVYEVYPQAITHDEKFDTWFVDYSKFAPLMLQELKSLRERVKQLETGE